MDDLLSKQGRKQLCDFYKRLRFCMENGVIAKPDTKKNDKTCVDYKSAIAPVEKRGGKRVMIVSDCAEEDSTLRKMIDAFKAALPYQTDEFNLTDFEFSGGCLGCFKCAADGHCVYNDGFEDVLRAEILTADALFYASRIKDHCLGSNMKRFHDRQFCNGHRILTNGKATGYILDGVLSREHNLKDVMEARSEVGHMVYCGAAASETDNCAEIDGQIKKLADYTAFVLQEGISVPQSFLGVGGTKVFRDLIFLMQGFMKADHKHYKKHGIYDYPYKRVGFILKMKMIGFMMRSRFTGKRVASRMNDEMIKPYKEAVLRDEE